MSQKNQYRVTPRAFEDLVSIGRHTERNWGKNSETPTSKQLNNASFDQD